MKRISRIIVIVFLMLLTGSGRAGAQTLVESIAAIVGNEVIYLSDIESAVIDYRRAGNKTPVDQLRCNVLREGLVTKLFLDQSRIDSITVTDDAVEGELNMSINKAIREAGSEKALEEYFNKSMVEIRRDIRKVMVEQEIVRQVQS